MNKERVQPPKHPFKSKLEALVDLSTIRPLELTKDNIEYIREALKAAGLNIEGLSGEEKTSLRHPQFRNLESGRGPGVVAVMGRERADELLRWCAEEAKGGPRIVSAKTGESIEGSEGRGLRQTAADLITMAALDLTNEELQDCVARINMRVYKGALRETRRDPAAQEKVKQVFATLPEPPATIASVAPSSLVSLWRYLTGKWLSRGKNPTEVGPFV